MVGGQTARWVQGAALAAPVAWILGAGWHYRWMTEDGYVYLRVVRQLEAGNGPVFNAGERVEACTGTLWVAVLTVADLVLPFRLEWIAVVGGLLLTGLGVALATAGSLRLWGADRGDALVVPAGSLVFVAVTAVWSFATSGLENGLAFAWIGACTWVLGRWASSTEPLRWPGACLLGLGWLVRPELVLLSAVLLLAVVVADRRDQGWGARLRLAAAAAALPLAYQLFRMGYFGSASPNTGIVKEGARPAVARGLRYLRDLVEPYWLFVPAAALLVGAHVPFVRGAARRGDRRRVAAVLGLTGGALANAAYVVLVGGDYHHGRLLLPALLAAVAPVAVVPVARRHAAVAVVAAWAVVAAIALRPTQFGENPIARGFLAARPGGTVTVDGDPEIELLLRTVAEEGAAMEDAFSSFRPLPFPLDPDVDVPVAVLRGVGLSGYALDTDVYVLDTYGLADTITAHLERRPPGRGLLPFAGHEKPLPDPWIVARLAAADADLAGNPLPPFGEPLIERTDGQAFLEEVAWARAALRCPDIAELLDAASADLTPGRFLRNLVGSLGNARLRIPPDPEEAYRRFCGDDVPPEVAEVRARSEGTS